MKAARIADDEERAAKTRALNTNHARKQAVVNDIAAFFQLDSHRLLTMLITIMTEVYDILHLAYDSLAQFLQGVRIRYKYTVVGATTSYSHMRPGTLHALDAVLYVGEEAGEVAEYQLLTLMAALSTSSFPHGQVDINTGRAITSSGRRASLFVDAAWPQLILIGDHQQLRPLLKAEGVQGSPFQASAFERLVNLQAHLRCKNNDVRKSGQIKHATANIISHTNLHANRRSHPAIVAPFRCVYTVEIDALVGEQDRHLIPDDPTVRRALEYTEYANCINPTLGKLLKNAYGNALMVESRDLSHARESASGRTVVLQDTRYGAYDSALPGVFCRFEGARTVLEKFQSVESSVAGAEHDDREDADALVPIPGRVVLVDVDAMDVNRHCHPRSEGGDQDQGVEPFPPEHEEIEPPAQEGNYLDFAEERRGTSRMNSGMAWTAAALIEHLVKQVGIARKDISYVAPYAAQFFLEKEAMEFVRLLPKRHSTRVQRALLDFDESEGIKKRAEMDAKDVVRILKGLHEELSSSERSNKALHEHRLRSLIDLFSYSSTCQIGTYHKVKRTFSYSR